MQLATRYFSFVIKVDCILQTFMQTTVAFYRIFL